MILRKILVGFGIAVAALVTLVVLAFLALMIYTYQANSAANEGAEAVCQRLPAGTDIAAVVAAPPKEQAWNRVHVNEGEYRFAFYGALLYSRECVAQTRDGKVVSTQLRTND